MVVQPTKKLIAGTTVVRMISPVAPAIWSILIAMLVLILSLRLTKKQNRERIGGMYLVILAIAGTFFANGLNFPTYSIVAWIYTHIPLAGIYVDPSKFLFFPVLLYTAAIATFYTPYRPNVSIGKYCSERSVKVVTATLVGILIGAIIFPFLRASTVTIGPSSQFNISRLPSSMDSLSARVLVLPPQQYVNTTANSFPYYDPLQVYPQTSLAKLNPSYNGSAGNEFLRWLDYQLYLGRTRNFQNLATLAGVGVVVARPSLTINSGNSMTQGLITPQNLSVGLHMQRRPFNREVFTGQPVYIGYAKGRILSLNTGVVELMTSDRNVMDGIASTVNLSKVVICFQGQCGAKPDVRVGLLNDGGVASGRFSASVSSVATYTDPHHWINGSVAYGEGYGIIVAQMLPSVVGIGSATGVVNLDQRGIDSHKPVYYNVETVGGPDPVSYRLACAGTSSIFRPHTTRAQYYWTTWRVRLSHSPRSACVVSMSGKFGAITAFQRAAPVNRPQSQPNVEFILPFAASQSDGTWEPRLGVFSSIADSVGLSRFGSLTFDDVMPGSIWVDAHAIGDQSTIGLSAASQTEVSHTPSWHNLGGFRGGELHIGSVEGGVVVDRIAVSDKQLLLSFRNGALPNYKMFGNTSLQSSSSVRLIVSTRPTVSKSVYLVAREGGAIWRMNGITPIGSYAGYGSMWRVSTKTLLLTNVTSRQALLGLIGSLVALGVLVTMWLWPALVRRRSSNA